MGGWGGGGGDCGGGGVKRRHTSNQSYQTLCFYMVIKFLPGWYFFNLVFYLIMIFAFF